MMKGNSIVTILAGLLGLGAVATVGLSIRIITGSHFVAAELVRLQPRIAQISTDRNVMQVLANDVFEYSKKNPAVDPILATIGLKATNAPAAAPANRPPTR